MKSCQQFQSLIATSLYETPLEKEAQELASHLAVCAACAEEQQNLRALVQAIPCESIPFAGDLRPALRARLLEEGASRRVRFWPIGASALVAMTLVCIGTYLFVVTNDDTPSQIQVATSEVDQLLSESQRLRAAGDFVAARGVLESGIATVGSGSDAGRLTLAMAEIECVDLHRYSESYDLYAQVRLAHSEVWAQSSGVVKERFDLLTEAREANFEPLYQIDAGRSMGEQGIPTLESVMARYPGRGLADTALTVMASMVGGDGVQGYEQLKTRISNPIALAQVNVRLGEGYWTEMQDPSRGRQLLEGVAQGPHNIPAEMARGVLARLESNAHR